MMLLKPLLTCFLYIVIPVLGKFQLCLKLTNPLLEVVTRYSDHYGASNYQFNLRKPINPLGYMYPKSTTDVETIIRCARKYDINLSIMSGKHSFEKYSYGSNDSWILNLSKLDRISINSRTNIVTIEAGSLLGNISQYLWINGKYGIPVGSCLSVGISGFALGGGIGLTTRKYGTMVDNTVGYEIVTPDGKIRDVTNTSHKDLYWALRGAGANNFGVVTKFYIRLFDASKCFILINKFYELNNLAELFSIWQNWTSSNVSRSVTSIFGRVNTFANTFYITFAIYDKDETEARKQSNLIKARFPNITNDDLHQVSYIDLIKNTSIPYWSVGSYPKVYHRVKGFYVSRVLSNVEANYFASIFLKYRHIGFGMEMHNGAVNDQKPSETAFVHRSSLYVFHIRFFILVEGNTTVEKAIEMGEMSEKQINDVHKYLQFMSNGEVYQNYPEDDLEDWCQRYYGDNCERLKRIKRLYDPTNFFRYNQSLPLK